jgi:hypothetical protein
MIFNSLLRKWQYAFENEWAKLPKAAGPSQGDDLCIYSVYYDRPSKIRDSPGLKGPSRFVLAVVLVAGSILIVAYGLSAAGHYLK